MNKSHNLVLKIAAYTVVILSLVSLIIFATVYSLFPQLYNSLMEDRSKFLTDDLAVQLPLVATDQEVSDLLDKYEEENDLQSYLVDSNGKVVGSSYRGSKHALADGKINLDNYIKYTVEIERDNQIETLTSFLKVANHEQLANPFQAMFPYIVVMIILIAVIIAYFTSYLINKPIDVLNRKAKAITDLDFKNELEWASSDEFGKLSDSLGVMQDRMKQVIDYLEDDAVIKNQIVIEEQRKQMSILSHELNTPLTVLKMQTELMLASERSESDQLYLKRNLAKVDEITKMVEQLLALEPSEEREEINVVNYIENILDSDYQDQLLQVTVEDELELNVAPLYFKRLITNLINNARKYNYNNQPIIITISSHGISFANKYNPQLKLEREKIMKPYVRSTIDDRIKGQGLGLFICNRICQIEGLKLEIDIEEEDFIASITVK